ncbi:ribonucleoside-diphosphate reductase subunit alpha [Aureimonas sp. AU40]|uniref:ribonucleoside-diphosphate reductase subunit alpha n=1 Tax=Aureimonas sp. AU40 TaxID=1637747 RepID=UPI0007865630|nr:ribonucleoside-diphosphate reductase subunit alpha [Aureimonas sp. AU40]
MLQRLNTNSAYWLNDDARTFLERGYLAPGQTAEDRIRVIADAAERILKIDGFADKLERYILNGWISLASPIWSNFGLARGLPISCNNSHVPDDTSEILRKVAEVGMMTKHGAGTSAFLGELRHRGATINGGGESQGPVHFMELFQADINVISQSKVRRGNCACYLPVEHPDIMEFLDCREEHSPIKHLSIGVCITDQWMLDMLNGDEAKQDIWVRILEHRNDDGYPYIFWTDTVNNAAPDVYKAKGLRINGSNLCSEIALASTADESFVCDLSSLNLLHYDDWKDTDLPETLTYLLDAVMTEYIEKTAGIPFLEDARRFAINQRALGIGTLGWHSYLQSRMIPFEDLEARKLNIEIHKLIQEKTLAASRELARLFGEPPLLKGYGRRNVTLMAIAPTKSSSFILGQVSASIEPIDSNYFTADLAKGKFGYRNPYLQALLATYGRDNASTWRSILLAGGSVQGLDFLTDRERAVFKTFDEIRPDEIITQAAHRQRYIDQAQSLNLKIRADMPVSEVHDLMIKAWRMKVKTLYYQKGTNPAQDLVRDLMSCAACEA